MARPKKAATERRQERHNVRLTVTENAEVERLASAYGLTVAEYMRRRALGHRLPAGAASQRQTALLTTALLRLGVNVNQIAHRLNAGGREPGYLPALIARINAALDALDGPGTDEGRTVV